MLKNDARITLRMPKEVLHLLQKRSKDARWSMNLYIVDLLEKHFGLRQEKSKKPLAK